MTRKALPVHDGDDEPRRRRSAPGDVARVSRWGTALLFLAALLLRLPVSGTVVVEKSFADLTAEADLIFVGTVSGVESRWADEQKSAIETIVTFTDLEPLLGAVGGEVSLRFGGGEVDGLREQIAGMPRFEVGERVVLFARRGRSLSPIIGFHQGCFQVLEGAGGPVVDPCATASSTPPVSSESAPLRLGAPGSAPDGEPLEDFLGRVRREIERRSGDR